MFEAYSPCPCGSGKKFKWCCQPIHASLMRVFSMDQEGQHEAAFRLMEEIIAQHPTNSEVWGRKALLLFQNEKPAEAEQALEKALELNPHYAFGYFLKGRFRQFEGEIAGALMLFRKATELYDPEAKEILAQVYMEIFECEMKLNHPIAAHAAVQLALKCSPGNDNLRKGIDTVFGKDNPNLPPSATQLYDFKSLPANASAERRAAWEAALKTVSANKLSDAVRGFEKLTASPDAEPAAWYNLALSHAWMGNHVPAVAALDRYVTMETDEAQATQAWTMAEVLCMGHGMEDQADILEHGIIAALRDPNAFVQQGLGALEREGLLAGVQLNQEENTLVAMILDPAGPSLAVGTQEQQSLQLGAYIVLTGNVIRMWNVNREALQKAFARLQEKVGSLFTQAQATRGPAKFVEVLSEGLTFHRSTSQEDAQKRLRDGFASYYEGKWVNQPLKSLNGITPAEAAKQPVGRKKLLGVVQFLRECCELTKFPYDVDRLAQKLELDTAPPAAAPTVEAGSPPKDYTAMSGTEMEGLSLASFSPAELEKAYQAALKVNAQDAAAKAAAELVARPAYPERPDRYPLFQLLIKQSLSKGDTAGALDHVNAGEKDDCENNSGKRRNEYELSRAQVHAKRGESEEAEQVFDRLIARDPSVLSFQVSAAEAMLSARQQSKALKYAQQGLNEALKQNNRDLEGHFRELMAAAQK
jgi:tetratricopeptide (TPR) repeat protein